MIVVDGKALAKEITQRVKKDVEALSKNGSNINFTAVIVGDNPASVLYVSKKQKACADVGINMTVVSLAKDLPQKALNNRLAKLSADKNTHGILLQLPLPSGLNAREAISYIAPHKDVDGLTAENFGYLATEEARLVPCTALGILHILKANEVDIVGKNVCVIGRSNIVGKPIALLLTAHDATVTLVHSKTKDLINHTQSADIVIAAAGKPGLLQADMVKQGVIVIDVGINRALDGLICGDVDFGSVSKKASLITPVPGGVGPLTIAFLLSNIVEAYRGRGDKKNV